MVCSLGTMDSALFFDAFTLHYTQIPLPAQLEFVVIHSGVSHSHATGSYHSGGKNVGRPHHPLAWSTCVRFKIGIGSRRRTAFSPFPSRFGAGCAMC